LYQNKSGFRPFLLVLNGTAVNATVKNQLHGVSRAGGCLLRRSRITTRRLIMSVGFYATLAGERLDSANRNYEQARHWNLKANQLEDALLDERDNNWRLQHQLNEAHQLNASWQAHAKQLEEKVRNWQQSAIESEAISRTQAQLMIDKHGQKVSEFVEASPEEVNQMIETKKQEVIQSWGIDPWKSE
jgi:hypothetical protein